MNDDQSARSSKTLAETSDDVIHLMRTQDPARDPQAATWALEEGVKWIQHLVAFNRDLARPIAERLVAEGMAKARSFENPPLATPEAYEAQRREDSRPPRDPEGNSFETKANVCPHPGCELPYMVRHHVHATGPAVKANATVSFPALPISAEDEARVDKIVAQRLVNQVAGPVRGYTGQGSIHGAAKGRALQDDEINPSPPNGNEDSGKP